MVIWFFFGSFFGAKERERERETLVFFWIVVHAVCLFYLFLFFAQNGDLNIVVAVRRKEAKREKTKFFLKKSREEVDTAVVYEI